LPYVLCTRKQRSHDCKIISLAQSLLNRFACFVYLFPFSDTAGRTRSSMFNNNLSSRVYVISIYDSMLLINRHDSIPLQFLSVFCVLRPFPLSVSLSTPFQTTSYSEQRTKCLMYFSFMTVQTILWTDGWNSL